MADIISGFPDSILCYILSFLPTKQALATSVLSKRWKLLWRSVPSLDFDHEDRTYFGDDQDGCSDFLLSVYSLLLWRDMDKPLHRLRFRCCSIYSHYSIETWIKAAVRTSSSLEHLDLDLYKGIAVPSVVFRCKTLVVLKLANLVLRDVSFVDFPLLKILHLNSICFSGCQDLLQQFLSGSPNLEDLEVKNFIANTAEKICPKDLVFDLRNLVQLEVTHVRLSKQCVEILEVLKHCPKLQTLVIGIDEYSYFSYCRLSEGYERALLPYLQSDPTCISSHLKACRFNIYRHCEVELLFAKYILQNAKFLQVMKFSIEGDARETFWMNLCIKRDLSSYISDTCRLSFE